MQEHSKLANEKAKKKAKKKKEKTTELDGKSSRKSQRVCIRRHGAKKMKGWVEDKTMRESKRC